MPAGSWGQWQPHPAHSAVLSALPAAPRLQRPEPSLSLQQYFQYETLQQRLKCLEEENQKLRMEVGGHLLLCPPLPHSLLGGAAGPARPAQTL